MFCVSRLLPDACFLQQDQGGCQNYTMVWFYDTKQNECSRFWYGGCDGNENRFTTQEECEHLCVTKSRWGGENHRCTPNTYQQNLQEHASSRNNTRFLSILNPSSTAESFWSGSVVHRFLLKRLQGNWNVPELCCWLKTFCFFLEHACLVSLLCLRSASPFLNKPPTFHNKNSDLLDVDQTREQRSCSTPSGSYQVQLWSRMNVWRIHIRTLKCVYVEELFFFFMWLTFSKQRQPEGFRKRSILNVGVFFSVLQR